MRIVTWNCNMKAQAKLPELLKLRPDVAILPECAAPEIAAARSVYGSASSHAWVGQYSIKGLAVLTFGAYTLEQSQPTGIATGKFALPVHVRGPVSFNLLALWTQGIGGLVRFVRNAEAALHDHEQFVRAGPAVVAGDLNSNSVWDRDTKGGHTRLVQRLRELGLESAYHAHFEEPHGAESRPTYFHRRAAGERFHLDYIFVPKEWAAECRVEVGEPEPWLRFSDHMPVVVSAAA
jgi:exonuclease III